MGVRVRVPVHAPRHIKPSAPRIASLLSHHRPRLVLAARFARLLCYRLSMLSQPSPSPSSSASTSTSTTASTSTAPAQTDIDFLDLSDDEESEEMYPFNYYPDEVMPRRRHACCARCTNELQTFDFDDDDSDRGVGLPRLSSTSRACDADRSPGVHQHPQPLRQLPHHP